MSIFMTGSYFHKKIILIVALVAFLIGGVFPVSSVEAAREMSEVGQSASQGAQEGLKGVAGPESESDEIACVKGSFPYVSLEGCIAVVTFTILQVASWVLWVAAILFNATINYSLNMANFIKDIPIVDVGWTVFRDVTNLLFIFIILYIAINTIIGNEGYGIKKLLGKVIVGAMLINFSLFFTQAMIDASNIFALQFYHKIVADAKGANTTSGNGANNSDYDSGISAAFVNAMGLQQIYFLGSGTAEGSVQANAGDENLSNTKLGLNAGNLILVSLGGTVLVLITAFVFFAGAFMLLARTVVLIFLMILSPIAFMGNILPALGKYTGEWWSKLSSNLLFAPVYMMLLYLVINMVTGSTFKKLGGGNGTFADMFAGGKNWIPTVITFVVLIMMMVGCLMIAAKLGVYGGKWAESFGKGMAKNLGMGLSGVGVAKWAGVGIGRGSAGWAGDKISESKFLARMSTKPGFGRLAAYTMQRGDKLKDVKIGGKSFNEQVKDEQKDYTKRGNLIESALQDVGPKLQGESDADYAIRKNIAKGPARDKEKEYLEKSRFSYASKAAIKKASKAAAGTDNKEALNSLLAGKWSPKAHEKATEALEGVPAVNGAPAVLGLNEQINTMHQTIAGLAPTPQNAAIINVYNSQLSSLIERRKEAQEIIKGHLDTVGKLSNLESK